MLVIGFIATSSWRSRRVKDFCLRSIRRTFIQRSFNFFPQWLYNLLERVTGVHLVSRSELSLHHWTYIVSHCRHHANLAHCFLPAQGSRFQLRLLTSRFRFSNLTLFLRNQAFWSLNLRDHFNIFLLLWWNNQNKIRLARVMAISILCKCVC